MFFKFKWGNRIRAGYFTVFLILFFLYVVTSTTSRKFQNQTLWVSYINETVIGLERIQSNLYEASSAFQMYLLTQDENSRRQYDNSRQRIDSTFTRLYRLTPSGLERHNLDTLHILIGNMFSGNDKDVLAYRGDVIERGLLKRIMLKDKSAEDLVKERIAAIQTRQKRIMEGRNSTLTYFTRFIKFISNVTLVVALILAVYALLTFNKENKAKKGANRIAEEYLKQLEFRIHELTRMNREITRLKSLEKFTAAGRIAETIGHEIKNPLTIIHMATDLLADEFPIGESNEFVSMIRRNGEKIYNLINRLLNATRFTVLQTKKVLINALIDEILIIASDRIELENIKVEQDYSEDICEVSIDVDKIKTAFLNIILNAIEAMEPGKGILYIRTEGRDNKCVIIIRDNGSGMDDETLSKLFEPYFTTKSRGSGFGLAQTQNIILSHQGSIEVESELGKGTCFIISLNFTDQDT